MHPYKGVLELAVAFKLDKHAVARKSWQAARTQESHTSDLNRLSLKKWPVYLQLRNGQLDSDLLFADTWLIQKGVQLLVCAGYQHPGRKRSADTGCFVNQGQMWQVNDRVQEGISQIEQRLSSSFHALKRSFRSYCTMLKFIT